MDDFTAVLPKARALTARQEEIVFEALHRLLLVKQDAYNLVMQELGHVPAPFTPADFAIPQIEGLITLFGGS